MLVTFPRMNLAELNTHRVKSRNSASSRAIPFKRMVEMVRTNPFIPLRWQKEHTGMQGTEYWTDELTTRPEWKIGDHQATMVEMFTHCWKQSAELMLEQASYMNRNGLTKQLCNRLLEPFAWHTVLITATEWENFFALRAHPAAEIHIAHLAELMLEAYNSAEVKQLQPGEWHIPFINDNLEDVVRQLPEMTGADLIPVALKVATARCAQTSYTLFGDDERPMDYPKLIALHDRLAKSGHFSPFEHCARAMDDYEYEQYTHTRPPDSDLGDPIVENGWLGNFRGFVSYRKLLPNENQTDSRVKH